MQLFRPKNRRVRPVRAPETNIRKQLLYGALTLLVVGGTLYGAWYVTRLPVFTINTITATGGETISETEVEKRVTETLEGNYFFFVPKRFTLLYPEDEVAAVVASVPRTENVAVSRDGTALAITYDERTPYALWCTENPDAPCVFLDENGYAFAPAPKLRGSSFIRLITEETSPETGMQPFSGDYIKNIYTFINSLESQFNFRVLSVVETKDKDLFYALSNGGKLYTAPGSDPETVFENLATILSSSDFEHLSSEPFAYIDLRFGNRVFVNEDGIPTTPTEIPEEPQYAKEPDTTSPDTGIMMMSAPTDTEAAIEGTPEESLPEEE